MALNKKLIHFLKLADFNTLLAAGNILDTSIVFIKDAKQIYTHGQLYSCSYTESELQELLNNKADATDLTDILTLANQYTDDKVANLVGQAPEALDTVYELAEAMATNLDAVDVLNEAIGKKVDKVTGKGLSTNDYTTAEKDKLAGIAQGATANIGTITGIKMNGASRGSAGVVDLGTVITEHQDISGKLDAEVASATYLKKTDAANTYLPIGDYATKSEIPIKVSELQNDANYISDDVIPNGVYAVTAEELLIDYNTADTSCIGVAIIAGEHKFMIARTDASANRLYWGFYGKNVASNTDYLNADGTNTTGYLGGINKTPILNRDFNTWLEGSLSDFEGKVNTTAIIAAYTELNVSMQSTDMCSVLKTYNALTDGTNGNKNDWYIPASGQLALIFLHRDEINTALSRIGGATLLTNFYISSTERDYNYIWAVHMNDGFVNYGGKNLSALVRFVRDVPTNTLKERVTNLESDVTTINETISKIKTDGDGILYLTNDGTYKVPQIIVNSEEELNALNVPEGTEAIVIYPEVTYTEEEFNNSELIQFMVSHITIDGFDTSKVLTNTYTSSGSFSVPCKSSKGDFYNKIVIYYNELGITTIFLEESFGANLIIYDSNGWCGITSGVCDFEMAYLTSLSEEQLVIFLDVIGSEYKYKSFFHAIKYAYCNSEWTNPKLVFSNNSMSNIYEFAPYYRSIFGNPNAGEVIHVGTGILVGTSLMEGYYKSFNGETIEKYEIYNTGNWVSLNPIESYRILTEKDVNVSIPTLTDGKVPIEQLPSELEELNAILVDIEEEADDPIVSEYVSLDVLETRLSEEIPTKTSQLTNDSGFLTQHQDISNLATKASAVSNITRNGNTFTATKADGNTFTFTLTDTTYSANNGITLSGTTFGLTSGIVTAGSKGPSSAVTGNNNTTVAIPRITVDTYGRVTGLTSYNLTCKNTTYSAATTSANGLMSSTDKSRLDFMHSSSAVTTLASLPAKAIVTATLSAATTISLASALTVGQSITVICTPTASFTQPIPTSGSFISMDGDSLSVTSGKVFEINILCYASGKYSISCKTAV